MNSAENVSDERLDIEAVRKERGPEWCTIFDTMRHHTLSNMVFEGTEDGYCLVDLMSGDAQSIETGEEQMLMLADEISLALQALRSPPTEDGDRVGEWELATKEARNLAVALHRLHYSEVTQWQPLDNLSGILSQIDNMTCGLVRRPETVGVSDAMVERARKAFDESWDVQNAAPVTDPTPCWRAALLAALECER